MRLRRHETVAAEVDDVMPLESIEHEIGLAAALARRTVADRVAYDAHHQRIDSMLHLWQAERDRRGRRG